MHILCLVMLRQDSSCSLSHRDFGFIQPCTEKRKWSILSIYTACSASSPRRVFPPRNAVCACFSHVCLASVLPTVQSAQACCRSFETGCNLFCVFSLAFHTGCVFPGAAFLVPKKTGDPHRDTIWSLPEAVNSSTWPGQAAACSCVLGGGKTGWRKIGQNS